MSSKLSRKYREIVWSGSLLKRQTQNGIHFRLPCLCSSDYTLHPHFKGGTQVAFVDNYIGYFISVVSGSVLVIRNLCASLTKE